MNKTKSITILQTALVLILIFYGYLKILYKVRLSVSKLLAHLNHTTLQNSTILQANSPYLIINIHTISEYINKYALNNLLAFTVRRALIKWLKILNVCDGRIAGLGINDGDDHRVRECQFCLSSFRTRS